MTTIFYVDKDGKYLGGMSEEIQPPGGWIAVPTPPQDASQIYKDGNWSEYKPRLLVSKSTVQDRIIAKNKMADAWQMMVANPNQLAKWFAPNHPAVYCDDPEATAFVQALGLDPKEILAPE